MSNAVERSKLSAIQADKARATPWWRVPMVWLVISGPVLVVIASFFTLGLAIKYPDPVLSTTAEAVRDAGQRSGTAGSGAVVVPAEVPAMQGRNHATTGG
ncbi:MAG: hypothetical protein RLY71_3850 [Pseudomonadota bacterium]|jgi:hypothetical protein